MRQVRVFMVALLAALACGGVAASSAAAREKAQQAYRLMEDRPFDSVARKQAHTLIVEASRLDPVEPWLYIALSQAALLEGYNNGSFFQRKSYTEGSVDKAQQYAQQAVELEGRMSMAHANLARMLIINGQYRDAESLLNRAYLLDNYDFYPWYYRAVISISKRDHDAATKNLNYAEKKRSTQYQRRLITLARQRLAERLGDKPMEEEMYLRNIRDFPDNAYLYGNYGDFLLNNDRYGESVEYYQKAIAITPYPLAQRQLAKALQLRDQDMNSPR